MQKKVCPFYLKYTTHDTALGNFKDLLRKAAADKILHDKAFNLAKSQNMTDINAELLQWFMIVLIKRLLIQRDKQKSCHKLRKLTSFRLSYARIS